MEQVRTLYYSGARPAVTWVCALGLLLQYVVGPICTFVAALFSSPAVFPHLDDATLISLAGVLLGFGGLRTAEKIKSVATT